MKGAIMLSGGGTKLFATIGVTYPAGSTLTCTNGSKTLTAKTTSGQWVFAIPETGTWTVTATDGTNTKSESVSITAEGQWESVTLSYQFVLYSLETGLAADYTLGVGEITEAGLEGGLIAIKQALDVTEYKTMTVKFGSITSGFYLGVGLRNSYSTEYEGYGDAWKPNFAAYANVNNQASATWSGKTKTINISRVTGNRYVKASAHQTTIIIESIIFA